MKNVLMTLSLMAGVALAPGAVHAADGASVAERIAGTWSLVSLDVQQGDNRIAVFGSDPRGIQIMSPNGRFAVITMRSDLPLYASGNRMQGTEEEYRTIIQGSNTAYGRYTIDESAGTITFHVEGSTFPNWEGQNQVRYFTLDGDEWRYTNSSLTIGDGNAYVVWRRLD